MCLLDCMAKAHVYLQVPGTRPLRGRARRARGLCARTCTTRLGTSRACAHTVRQGDILCVRCVVSVRSRCRATVHTINVPTYQGRGMVPRSMCPPIRGLGWYLDQCAHLSGAWDGTSIDVPTYQGLGMVPRSMCPPIRGVGWYLDQCAHLSGVWDGTSINVPTYQGRGMVPRSMCPPIRGMGWYCTSRQIHVRRQGGPEVGGGRNSRRQPGQGAVEK